ncbi:Endonuclease, Uma2 family (restriction endonuclease fold) [Streptomyces zhaozhouensis]|uniref:Endonuclease, Uma2 family (Restriction endonuclease fold) n=1 Tax=Streptomyces zhaozhouensis TaxID=1300267 RepID=A0A286DV07_9ACTN|nr:Uma2 family endonuclease [Streptomyces zhaozhouensis]SOD62501.1 Endonuclease, Uma2 family (restriction endonuclease fold) [Streptomyces zhaozhouensis]
MTLMVAQNSGLASADDPGAGTPDDILDVALRGLEVPEGFRVEVFEEEIVVTPPPDGDHEYMVAALAREVLLRAKVEMLSAGNKGLLLPRGGLFPLNRVVPDATFAPLASEPFRGAPAWMTPEGVSMVAEITSSRPERDRVDKLLAYAQGGIPLYLLIDRDRRAATLFSEPSPQGYAQHHQVLLGKPLPLPDPFAFDLDTGRLL